MTPGDDTMNRRDGASATASNPPGPTLQLSALQLAWLTEIGLDRRMLARYAPQITVTAAAIGTDNTRKDASSGLDRGQTTRRTAAFQASPVSVPGLASLRTRKTAGAGESLAPVNVSAVLDIVGRADVTAPSANVTVIPAQDLPTDWGLLNDHVAACQSCELHAHRDQPVFGAGDTQSPEWLIVGEAPGQSDDRTGLPFQGKSGQLLHAMLVSIGVHPASVVLGSGASPTPKWSTPTSAYFTNIVKCRPLGNRSPAAQEMASCLPYLQRQVELLRPRRILALGRLAAQTLLQVTTELEDLRGRVHQVSLPSGQSIPLVATWHPAALLMHPQNKGQVWADLNLAKHAAQGVRPQG